MVGFAGGVGVSLCLALPEPRLSNNAMAVLESRYLKKDEAGRVVETPKEMFWRVAKNIALMDALYDPQVYRRPEDELAGSPRSAVGLGAGQEEAGPRSSEEWEWGAPAESAGMGHEVTEDAEGGAFMSDLTRWDWAALRHAFEDMVTRGLIAVSWDEIERVVARSSRSLARTAVAFYNLMAEGRFMPNSPALSNAGRELQQLSACFVLPIEDSMVSIFDTLKHAALIHQSGGGTGFSFSRLRPKNDVVRTTGGVASGPVSFMKVFNAATEAVKQGGVRRGANMGILRVDHPDILEFITVKNDPGQVTNFNISVALTSKFMEALEHDGDYELVNPRSGEVTGRLRAREVFDLIVECAWRTGEPGIIFIDRLNEFNPTPNVGMYEATNPCGEQMLLPYEACNLGSINVAKFVTKRDGGDSSIDWDELRETVRTAMHFLDNMIDASRYPLPEIEAMHKGNRKVGLGVMGWADFLAKVGVPYDSDEAVALAEEVMSFILEESRKASVELARHRGVFPNWKGSRREEQGLRVRNATTTTIAPTGTISIIAGASSGIEPFFSLAFTRHVLDRKELVEVNPVLEARAKELGVYTPELMEEIGSRGTLAGIAGIPDEFRRAFVTAHEIEPEWHVKMQAAFQRYTDNAVSKTVNFPHDATREDVEEVFRLAYELGCKGVTVYRDGSREEQVLTVGAKKGATQGEGGASGLRPGPGAVEAARTGAVEKDRGAAGQRINGVWGKIRPIDRPDRLEGFTDVKATPLGKLFLTLNTVKCHPIELFAQIGKAGSDVAAFTEAIARLVSIALRSGVDPQEIADQLVGIGGSRSIGFGPNRVRSVPDAIGRFLDDYLRELRGEAGERHELGGLTGEAAASAGDEAASAKLFSLCPSCGTWNLVHMEGCLKCMACGYSEC
ncbi:MAG: ribonucleoside-diphosphate reductase alpha chain [Bacillota bacterium]|nr:ribonucleoside-diphosphate reductase alpha chain [Bacillota bacterium]